MKRIEIGGFYFNVPDSNNIEERSDRYGNLYHDFQIFESEPFNLNRRKMYIENRNVVDGDLICHKGWLDIDSKLNSDGEKLDINFDPRIYIVVKSFDGKGFALTFNELFYAEYVNDFEHNSYAEDILNDWYKTTYDENNNKIGIPNKKIIPLDELSDDYILVSTNSNLMKEISRCQVIEKNDHVITCGTDVYGVEYKYLLALRIIAFIYSLSEENVVLTYDGNKYKDYLKSAFYAVSRFKTKYCPVFIGHYDENLTGLLLCRLEVAKQYEKKGFKVLNVTDLISGRYYENEHIRKRTK